jgi:transcription-repair coupling factor (superfamily II helicase)
MSSNNTGNILIVSVTPYFLEKGNFWFEENLKKILEAGKTQSFFEDNVVFLEKNQNLNLSHFLRKLDEMGYEKVLSVSFPGEFSHRGGAVDVFPVNSNNAFRFDFFGNKIENIEILPVAISDEKSAKEIIKKRLKSQKLFSDLKGIKCGDYLVHLDHGIARFAGIEKIGESDSYYILEYSQGDKLFIPLGLERKLSRYVGFVEPKISRLGSMVWQQTKKKIKESAEKLAKELLEIYAKRETAARPPYAPDDEVDEKLASGFKYEETPDQLEAISEIKKDLEGEKPMDRILCGDVGFGKTEVALRTMVRAVKSGYQTAMICPTTILAHQHFQNFKERLKDLPIRLSLLSRLESEKEQDKTVEEIKNGKTDIVVGTHRILSDDVAFQKLGLLVIDDEQRFGVKQKEKLKKLRESLDVLSLSATPIPRTLYLALSSMKNISIIQTPPAGRLPVKTSILPFSKKIIKKAIGDELKRNGQVYYLHNRVETIEMVKKYLQELSPRSASWRIGIGHGRLSEKELVSVMDDFQNKKIDVLIATTIIENGIDLPNANTIIVDDATKLGLAQAYQIRGRIGRSHIQGYSYFFHGKRLSEKAKLRLNALKEFEELGSGYKIAMRDLEIRGAGNVLGKEQSGNINRVGLNLYCQMLSEAVEKLKSQA